MVFEACYRIVSSKKGSIPIGDSRKDGQAKSDEKSFDFLSVFLKFPFAFSTVFLMEGWLMGGDELRETSLGN